MLRKGRGLVRGTGVVVDGKHHDGYSWAWKKPIITIVIISLTAINNSRFVMSNSLKCDCGAGGCKPFEARDITGTILGLECPGAKTVYDMSSKNTGLYCLRCILQLNSR